MVSSDSRLIASRISKSVHHRQRQKLEIANLKFAVFLYKNDLEIEVWIKILVLLQFLNGDTL
jgi:hypothetical protein